ncbi:putative ATP/GTP binding protein [Parafrankia sp. EAN1pec]|nr:putative ATP/GTP binding protein [Frankia sp. EAN1pec]
MVALVVTVVLVRRYDWEPAGTILAVITPALTIALLAYGTPLVFTRPPSPEPDPAGAGPPPRVDGPPVGALPARNRLFTGRAGQLERIRRQLQAGPVAVTALHGMGGVGKTQLALEYAHRHTGDYTLIWWIDAEQTTLLAEKIATLARPLGLPTTTVPETASGVLAALARRPGWLVVFDNAEHPTALAPWLPTGPGHVLITSRNPAWEHLAATVDVDLLPRPESVALLTHQLPGLDPAVAGALADELGDLPLALAQAGAYLARTRTPPRDYLAQFRARRAEYLATGDPPLYAGRLDTCWSLSLQRLAADAPAAVWLLQACALLAPDPIPLALFPTLPLRRRRWWHRRHPPAAGQDVREAVAAAADYSLLRHHDSDGTLTVHRLVQAVIAGQLTDAQRRTLTDTTTRLLTAATPTHQADDPRSWPAWTALGPHLLHAHSQLTGPDDPHHLRTTTDQFCYQLYARGDYTAANTLALRLHRDALHHHSPDHPTTLAAAHTLATTYNALGHHQAARQLAQDTLARQRRVLGDNHPRTLTSANNLAAQMYAMGEHQAARQLAQDTLARQRRVLGNDHPRTLTSANNLATYLSAMGEHQAARQLDEDTLARRRRVLGDNHPNTLTSAGNLAGRLGVLGEHQAARQLAQDTLARQRRVLGDNHPNTQQTERLVSWIDEQASRG